MRDSLARVKRIVKISSAEDSLEDTERKSCPPSAGPQAKCQRARSRNKALGGDVGVGSGGTSGAAGRRS